MHLEIVKRDFIISVLLGEYDDSDYNDLELVTTGAAEERPDKDRRERVDRRYAGDKIVLQDPYKSTLLDLRVEGENLSGIIFVEGKVGTKKSPFSKGGSYMRAHYGDLWRQAGDNMNTGCLRESIGGNREPTYIVAGNGSTKSPIRLFAFGRMGAMPRKVNEETIDQCLTQLEKLASIYLWGQSSLLNDNGPKSRSPIYLS